MRDAAIVLIIVAALAALVGLLAVGFVAVQLTVAAAALFLAGIVLFATQALRRAIGDARESGGE